ncbi:MAG: MmcQ/YjbR family DNA-binding protein [Pseudomonadota bacterium]
MDLNGFLCAARACPEAVQSGHNHMMDFRVRKKVFATYDPKLDLAGLNLLPEQQAHLMACSDAFFPANGIWGERGWTKITLGAADDETVRDAVMMAWAKTAPISLVKARQSS